MPNFSFSKWGASSAFGTPGGVVTWSVIAPGISGVDDAFETGRSNVTSDPDDRLWFDAETQLTLAFAAWSEVANIEFVQVADSGARVGQGASGDIRVAFGAIDGRNGDTLAVAFFPTFEPVGGDILFDASETGFFDSRAGFRAVAIHEIGHSIGLEHILGVRAIMNPRIDDVFALLPDDIQGARAIYGAQDGRLPVLRLGEGQDDVRIEGAHDGLAVIGTSTINEIVGGGGAERLRGGGGDDFLAGRGGADVLRGGDGDDFVRGGAGADAAIGSAGDDVLRGNGGADTLRGGAGQDSLFGGGGADLVRGGAGADRLKGNGGDDRLIGSGGGDVLFGGGGSDYLRGGHGADRFIFRTNGGDDTVVGYEPGVDRLDYARHGGVASRSDLRFIDGDAGAIVSDGMGGRVLLRDVALDELSADDFLF